MFTGDLKTEKGIGDLDKYLIDKSYVSGYQPSQADVKVFNDLNKEPDGKFKNVTRWYNHIKSYGKDERKKFPAATGENTASSKPTKNAKEDDDDIDLFSSGEDDGAEEVAEARKEILKAYHEKKSKKAAVIAKSSIILDIKPWDDETDMSEMEKSVRKYEMDGLVWGASKLVPVGYGIKKLQIMCVVEDEKVSVDLLIEELTESLPDFIQSIDIAAFNKI